VVLGRQFALVRLVLEQEVGVADGQVVTFGHLEDRLGDRFVDHAVEPDVRPVPPQAPLPVGREALVRSQTDAVGDVPSPGVEQLVLEVGPRGRGQVLVGVDVSGMVIWLQDVGMGAAAVDLSWLRRGQIDY